MMKKILCLVVCFASFVILSAKPQKKTGSHSDSLKLKGIYKDCFESQNASLADMETIGNDTIPSTREGKCYLGCFGEKMGFLENGTISGEKLETLARNKLVKDKVKMEMALRVIQSCEKDFVGATNDKCQAGVILFTCLIRFGKEIRGM